MKPLKIKQLYFNAGILYALTDESEVWFFSDNEEKWRLLVMPYEVE